jgi:hypothetical protein
MPIPASVQRTRKASVCLHGIKRRNPRPRPSDLFILWSWKPPLAISRSIAHSYLRFLFTSGTDGILQRPEDPFELALAAS